jgi:DNA polymerase bacteriophage-type
LSDVFFDFETRSMVPISRGTDLYTRDAEPIILSWAVDDAPVQVWDILANPQMPDEVLALLNDRTAIFIAHNCVFDRSILKWGLGFELPVERTRCTRAIAYAHGLPGSLEALGAALRLPVDQQKRTDDARLIHIFCVPDGDRITTPEERPADWKIFLEYARRDTEALRAIYLRLPKHNFTGFNVEFYGLDQLINDRGFKIDTPLAHACIDILARAKGVSDESLSSVTEGAVTAATQRARLLSYLAKKHGLDLPNMRAATLREMLESDDLDPDVRWLLQARLDGAKSAGAKFKAGLKVLGPGERIRHSLQISGAGRTGRHSAKGFQVHNTMRPAVTIRTLSGRMEKLAIKAGYVDEVIIPAIYSGDVLKFTEAYGTPNEACGIAVRHAIIAEQGNELVAADLSNIESVVLAWIAGEDWKLNLFRAKMASPENKELDAYRILYSRFFGTLLEKVNENERQAGKVVELSCGFGGGVGAIVRMASDYNIDLDTLPALILPSTDEATLEKAYKAWRRAFLRGEDYALDCPVYQACDVLKQKYRAANTKIDDMRRELGRAVIAAIKERGGFYDVARCKIWCNEGWLIIELPNKDRLLYASPRIDVEVETDPYTGKTTSYEYVTYITARGKGQIRQKAWSGLFVENIVQAVANRVLRVGLMRVHANTLLVPEIAKYLETLDPDERTAVVLHVHDEIVLEVPIGSYSVGQLIEDMTAPIDWAPGLPLMAAGWKGPRYGKR